ncbi:hypothetical protein CMUS01_03800 [Colletotrichum musicola]|uniref:Uncharacterized protein n=1 Tax=Colletotrichum musicola TaxID=2175873 RepID=A0A8H6NQK4_9PEZI|nr:hypothetical protein CMUS01_03800 [Colletotrichum musicola]
MSQLEHDGGNTTRPQMGLALFLSLADQVSQHKAPVTERTRLQESMESLVLYRTMGTSSSAAHALEKQAAAHDADSHS